MRAEISVSSSQLLQTLQRELVQKLNQETRELGLMPKEIKEFDFYRITPEGRLEGIHRGTESSLVITYGAEEWKNCFRALSTLKKALVAP